MDTFTRTNGLRLYGPYEDNTSSLPHYRAWRPTFTFPTSILDLDISCTLVHSLNSFKPSFKPNFKLLGTCSNSY